MGLFGSVGCTCLADGRTAPMPFPAELFGFDEDGEPAIDAGADDDSYRRYLDWIDSCCPHPGLTEVAGKVSTWNGVQAFAEALKRIGPDRFPVLLAGTGRSTGPGPAARALVELAAFRAVGGVIGELVLMVETGTGAELGRFDASLGGPYVLAGSGPEHVSYDERGLFVVPAAEQRPELFRAMRVEQRAGAARAEYVDLDTGRRFEGRTPVEVRHYHPGGGFDVHHPARLHVERRPFGVERFAGQVATLESLFEASVRTGNPVRWSA